MRKRNVALLVIAAGLLFATASLSFLGSIVVFDSAGVVEVAEMKGSLHRKRLANLGIVHFGVPGQFDGVLRVRCRSGSVVDSGYLTPSVHDWVKVTSACRVVQL